ncbi:MAG TPA: glycosyl hydrolase family 8, partial [Acidimicrobiia bacterium]
MRLDLVIPAHNEEHRIGRTLEAYRAAWSHDHVRFLVALDRCTDRTAEIASAHARVDERVGVIEYPKRRQERSHQAYALLLAAAIGDRARFELVWAWTAANLQRPDGLLAWHWADGSVADAEPAADADLVTSRALLLAGERFDEPAYRDEGVRVG